MTTEQIEMARVIAEYDGLIFHTPKNVRLKPYWRKYNTDGVIVGEYFDGRLLYLTSMDWLHPVAMKVMDELEGADREDKIHYHCATKPINDQYIDLYIDLFTAVFNGIVFLNEQTVNP